MDFMYSLVHWGFLPRSGSDGLGKGNGNWAVAELDRLPTSISSAIVCTAFISNVSAFRCWCIGKHDNVIHTTTDNIEHNLGNHYADLGATRSHPGLPDKRRNRPCRANARTRASGSDSALPRAPCAASSRSPPTATVLFLDAVSVKPSPTYSAKLRTS
jgi:hypothetical protein